MGRLVEPKKTKKLFLARESSSGDLYWVKAKDEEDAYHVFAKAVQGEDQEDTGNVDIDLKELPTYEEVKDCVRVFPDEVVD